MKQILLLLSFSLFLFTSACQEKNDKKDEQEGQVLEDINEETIFSPVGGNTIAIRFDLPAGYIRKISAEHSFARNLRHFPLYPSDREVRYYNGKPKWNQSHHAAVLNIDVGNNDLQQCADAVMRLRAEYLFEQKKYNEIAFHFVSGFNATYSDWRLGKRIKVNGNKVSWYQTERPSQDRAAFNAYLQTVFMYASTLSLEKELKPKDLLTINIGDVFIQGGSPGHAIIVMDVAINLRTKDRMFLLAQSYMPAQDIHILKNPMNAELSPWYSVADIDNELMTPEWTFNRNDLREF